MKRAAALRLVFRGRQLHRSIIVGIAVGTVLNLINQGDAILTRDGVIWWRLALTYFVPFCVTSYGAYSALRDS